MLGPKLTFVMPRAASQTQENSSDARIEARVGAHGKAVGQRVWQEAGKWQQLEQLMMDEGWTADARPRLRDSADPVGTPGSRMGDRQCEEASDISDACIFLFYLLSFV
eukprot:CAMPEP_0114157398 /NCGR_PEP_ID=MMETSP0043_2-20121206/26596_1 /TAXON_ID=464988 /ORGANISM="Hemiselmis andersenii, Strain CCMP644" /LENGTH=107 /DNA_ID=CAMNT_0001252955 /DNA_START=259 /DNA_END=580 /DNA_ORIENTATION=-